MKNPVVKIGWFTQAALSLSVVVLLTACHSVRRGEPFVGPMQLNSKQQSGQLVFQQRCHQCHPNGEAGLGPALNNKPAPVFLMKTQVRVGLGAMPRFDEHTISKAELDDLMAYVIALRKADKTASAKDEPKRDAK
jgi:mono/diheme cytochrome c family protein